MSVLIVLVALAIAVGLVGIVIPMVPGSIFVFGGILIWAVVQDSPGGWATFAVAASLIAMGSVIKYVVPGKRLASSGVPNVTLFIGGLAGIIGFFVVPVIGLPLGFVLGVYLAELNRTSQAEAWPSTVHALKAVGLGIAIEFAFSAVAGIVWAIGVIAVS